MIYFFSKLHLVALRFGGLELQWEEISSVGPRVTTWTVSGQWTRRWKFRNDEGKWEKGDLVVDFFSRLHLVTLG